MCLNVRNVMKHLNPEVTVLMDMSLEQEKQNNAFDEMFVVEKVSVANYLNSNFNNYYVHGWHWALRT